MNTGRSLEGLLIDTWWFGMTHRLSGDDFIHLAELRARQGFNAVQLVVGIPPEVAPSHPHAASEAGAAWDLGGHINNAYLRLARERIQALNHRGLRVIVYGAWGMQIDWTNADFMKRWWARVVETLDDLNVVYCLTGESDLWADTPGLLLPNRSTDDLVRRTGYHWFPEAVRSFGRRVWRRARRSRSHAEDPLARRRRGWGEVLKTLAGQTRHPIIVHTSGQTYSHAAVEHQELLAATTAQTGHDYAARPRLWRYPMEFRNKPTDRYINLEPWYEGIRDQFWAEDQLYAYWVSVLSGACSHAYGAQGIWNVGDGQFLAHWGRQTFDQACWLETPALLGASHHYWKETLGYDPTGRTVVETTDGKLQRISRHGANGTLSYYPDVTHTRNIPDGEYWLPLEQARAFIPPSQGPLVVWRPSAG